MKGRLCFVSVGGIVVLSFVGIVWVVFARSLMSNDKSSQTSDENTPEEPNSDSSM